MFTKVRNEQINVQEAHILWRLLTDRYIIVDHLNQLKNFTHDRDFLYFLNKTVDAYWGDIRMLEAELERFNISGPPPASRQQNAPGNSEIVSDRDTAEILYGFMRLDIGLKLSSLRDVSTNDRVRGIIEKLIQASTDRVNTLIKYLKLKNWIALPPIYRVDPKTDEKVAVNEIYLLWDHLIHRYNNIRQTEICKSFASDPDFKILLDRGVKILRRQIKTLEDKLISFEVVLPKPYTTISATPGNKELIEDEFMFNLIVRGIQDSIALHGLALQEVIVNDQLREFFRNLTLEEIKYSNSMIKYGKMKGWVFVTPIYNPSS